MINLSQIGRKQRTISFEKENVFHVILIILPTLRQFRAFGTHQTKVYQSLQQKLRLAT